METIPMRTYPAKKLFNVDDYYRMAEVGILRPDDRVELIRGEIIEMSPIGLRHAACVDRATEFFVVALHGRANVRVQGPNRLDNYNEPQPDVSVLKSKTDYYLSGHPGPENIYLVVEVSDTTLAFDRNVKLPMYAIARIPEVWIVDIQAGVLLIHREPEGDAYKTLFAQGREDSISPVAFPDVVLKVADLLV